MTTEGETILNNQFTFWLTFFNKSKDKQLEEFEDNMKPLGTFSTVEGFWDMYQHMKRPYTLPRGSEFFLFKAGIRPLWEDQANEGGGRFFISVKRSTLANKIWEDLLLALLLVDAAHHAINGVVLNVRTSEVFLSVWTAQLPDTEMGRYRSWIKNALDLPIEQIIDYKKHPNNAQMIQRQEHLIKEEEERKKREIEAEKKKEEDAERKRKQREEREKRDQNDKAAIEKLAQEIEDDQMSEKSAPTSANASRGSPVKERRVDNLEF
jgi:translation initiation factor 4E